MNHAAVSGDRRRPLIVGAGVTLLAMSLASFLIVSSEPAQSASLLLAYAGGMAMLLTPWTFPLALGIVPLSQRGRTGRGIALALLFGAGLTVTLTIWGLVIAGIGGFFGFREVARYLSIAGGGVSYILGLWTLRLVRFPLPSGSVQLPAALRSRSEYLGAFVLGLLLGNMGLCCPDPVFLSMIPFIAARGDIADGGLMAAAYGLGRATPLVGLVALASAGVDSFQLAARRKQAFDRVVGWGLVATGTFMLYGYSGVSHEALLAVTLMMAPVLAYHVKAQSSLRRAAAWLGATVIGTLAGMRLMYWVLVNLPWGMLIELFRDLPDSYFRQDVLLTAGSP